MALSPGYSEARHSIAGRTAKRTAKLAGKNNPQHTQSLASLTRKRGFASLSSASESRLQP